MGIQTSPAPFIRTSLELHHEDFGTLNPYLDTNFALFWLDVSTELVHFQFPDGNNSWQVAQFMSHPATDFHCKEMGLTSIHIIKLEKVIESRISCEHPHHPHHHMDMYGA